MLRSYGYTSLMGPFGPRGGEIVRSKNTFCMLQAVLQRFAENKLTTLTLTHIGVHPGGLGVVAVT
jgi:hypothetical protein